MATRYWVGGGSSTNWDAVGNTNWGTASATRDNASVPGPSDDVIFDSGDITDSVLAANITLNTLTIQSGYTGILTHSSAVTLTIAGDTFQLGSAMTYIASDNTAALSFTSTTGTSGTPTTITSNGMFPGNTTLNGAGGYFQLQDNLSNGLGAAVMTLTAGTFDTNSKTINFNFSSSNSNARTLNMTNTRWSFDSASTPWDCTTSTNMTLISTGSTIVWSNGTTTMQGGGLVYNDWLLRSTNIATTTIRGSNTFNNFTRDVSGGAVARTLQFESTKTQTIARLFLTGATSGAKLTVQATSAGSAATLSVAQGNVRARYVALKDSTATGGAKFYAYSSTSTSGNTGWIFLDQGPPVGSKLRPHPFSPGLAR